MTRHLLIASEQIWPNLLGLAWLIGRDGGVESLDILHTDDERRSALPARRIAAVARLMQPGLELCLHPTKTTSQSVMRKIHEIIEGGGGDEALWSLNVSGGTKTMFAGAAPFVRLPYVETFYREVSGQWFRLLPADLSGIQTLSCEELTGASDARVSVPVVDLVRAQAETPEATEWVQNPPPPALDLPALVERGIACRWDWRLLQKEFPSLSQNQTGFAFEDFFGALLHECGVTNFAASVMLVQKGVPKHELDLVVCTGEKIVVFDLKLSEEPDDAAVIDQISRLAEDASLLGGVGAVPIAVRPTWIDADGAHAALARAHRVVLWDQKAMGKLVEKLAKLLNLPMPAPESPVARVGAMLSSAAAEGQRLFSGAKVGRTPKTGRTT